MKYIILFTLFIFSNFIGNAQNLSNSKLIKVSKEEVKINRNSYTLKSQYDTIYSRSIELEFDDTLISSIKIKFSKKVLKNYSLLKDTVYQFNQLKKVQVDAPLQAYRKTGNIVVINFGGIPYSDEHNVNIEIYGIKPTDKIILEEKL